MRTGAEGADGELLSLSVLARRLPELVGALDEGASDKERAEHVRSVVHRELHDRVLSLVARNEDMDRLGLCEVADALDEQVPEAFDERLPIRVRTFVRLLRSRCAEAAWLVAKDNAVGTVSEQWRWSTSSGAARPQSPLPLLTLCDGGRVYAWLPGFRDPRYAAPDAAYDISDKVRLSCHLDQLQAVASGVRLSGWANLTGLTSAPRERVTVVARSLAGNHVHRFAGERRRRPDRVKGTGTELTRLAFSGWSASVDGAQLRRHGRTWLLDLELEQDGVTRLAPLGPTRSPLADGGLARRRALLTRRPQLMLDSRERLVLRV